jgi:hypothetical protein
MNYSMMKATNGTIDTFFTEHVVILHQEISDEMLDAK